MMESGLRAARRQAGSTARSLYAYVARHLPVVSAAFPQEINLQPKYGLLPKNEAQKTADAAFLAGIDSRYQGNRKKAAEDLSARGWQSLRRNAAPDAMRRFNQAWLADASNGSALWGMAVVQAGSGRFQESLELFAEAERVIGGDIDFAADHEGTWRRRR